MALKGQVQDDLSRVSQDLCGLRTDHEKTVRNLKSSKMFVLDLEKKIDENNVAIKGWESQAYMERRKQSETKMALEKEQLILKRVQDRYKVRSGIILKSLLRVRKSHSELKAESRNQIHLAHEAFKVTLSEIWNILLTYAR